MQSGGTEKKYKQKIHFLQILDHLTPLAIDIMRPLFKTSLGSQHVAITINRFQNISAPFWLQRSYQCIPRQKFLTIEWYRTTSKSTN